MSNLIHDEIDRHAAQRPEAEAARFRAGESGFRSLSYGELARRSGALAKTLVEEGVRRHDRVAILMDKSEHTPTAMYGILKAGAAYVPVDHTSPASRVRLMLQDCGARHVIAGGRRATAVLAEVAEQTSLECVIGLDAHAVATLRTVPWPQALDGAGTAPPVKILEDDLAYLIYTSGSTGVPKGIMHTHRSGLAFARWAAGEYGLVCDDRLSNHAPLHFDLSIFDWFAGAVAGACTVVIPEEYKRLPASYSELLAAERISVFFTVPFALIQLATLGALDQRDLSALRWVLFGGEPMPVKHLRTLMKALPGARFDNMYGPAEVNGCTHYTVPADGPGEDGVPIGPMSRIAEALIVDGTDNPVSEGATGELLVRTPTMMQGYWRRPDLDERAFFRTTPVAGWSRVYYRTGDLVRDVGGGVLEFLGRKDRQIKVRGYRVELDEVEAALAAHPSVLEAAVFDVGGPDGRRQVRAAVIPYAGSSVSDKELRAHLAACLPPYALPDSIEVRSSFPRTSTGKTDRKVLGMDGAPAVVPDTAASWGTGAEP